MKSISKGLMRSDMFHSSTKIGEVKYLTDLLVLYGLMSPFVLLPAVILEWITVSCS